MPAPPILLCQALILRRNDVIAMRTDPFADSSENSFDHLCNATAMNIDFTISLRPSLCGGMF
jgi:hypothetical protein